jgi:hypothetical protein
MLYLAETVFPAPDSPEKDHKNLSQGQYEESSVPDP